MKRQNSLGLRQLSAAVCCVLLGVALGACGQNNPPPEVTAPAQVVSEATTAPTATAPAPLSVQTSTTAAVGLGDLATDGLTIDIPAGALPDGTTVELVTATAAPLPDSAGFASLAAPIDVSAPGGPTRLETPINVTFQIPDGVVTAADWEDRNLWFTYFDGQNWVYLPPTSSDAAAHTITLSTYHFSLLGYGKISVEEQLKNYTHSAAVSSLIQSNLVDEAVNAAVSQTVNYILQDKLGLKDDALTAKILSSLANDDAYRDLVNQFNSGDKTAFAQTLAVFAGQKIAENAGEAALAGVLENLASDTGVGFAAAAGQAAGYLVEGDLAEAGRVIGEQIADQFLITAVAKGAVEVVQYQIDTWKDAEIEAAYQAYRDGADGVFWGYNVEPGQFGALWEQMRGIATRLQQEAVAREEQRRAELGLPPATDAQLDAVRQRARDALEKQFVERQAQEEALAAREAQIDQLITAMRGANLLELGSFDYSRAYDTLETRLDKLLHLAQKILRDTGRSDWTSGAFTTDKAISTGDMVNLMQAWFSNDGPKLYAQMLFERFGILPPLAVPAAELAGVWLFRPLALDTSSLTCTDTSADSDTNTDPLAAVFFVTLGSAFGHYDVNQDQMSLTWTADSGRIPAEVAPYFQGSGAVQIDADTVHMQTGLTLLSQSSSGRAWPVWLAVGAVGLAPGVWLGRRSKAGRLILTLATAALLAGCFGMGFEIYGTMTSEMVFTTFEKVGAENVPVINDLEVFPTDLPRWRLTGTADMTMNMTIALTSTNEAGEETRSESVCSGVVAVQLEALIFPDVVVKFDQ